MTNLILSLVQWAGTHPQFAGLLVAIVACVESLAFIGVLVPGAVLMLGAGALVGVGALNFWSTLAWAVGGAVLGDGISYWLGHRYQDRISRLGFLHAHPELLARGELFFKQHGGKSILLARFVGPVRPIVPVVAGMLGMLPARFYVYNVISALLWAPAHLLPGMAFGASLTLAGQVAGRLALGLGLFLVLVWFLVWSARSAYTWIQPQANAWAVKALNWGRKHPHMAWLIGDLMDPARPVSRSLLLWFVLLIAGGWLFFGVLEDVLSLDPIVYAGQSIYRYLQLLRTPVGDRIMIVLTEAGDASVAVPVSMGVLVWLLWKREWKDARYWLAAVGFGMLAVVAIKFALKVPRPTDLYSGIEAFSFPSGHVTLTTVIYGFLAVLSSRSFAPRWRWIPFTIAVLLVSGTAFSRLYLGAHWLADVAAGVGLGTAWVAVLAIARARHSVTSKKISGLPLLALFVFSGATTLHVNNQFVSDLERYAVKVPALRMSEQQWLDSGWQTLPAVRLDLQGEAEQPLNIQWAGDLQVLQRILESQGWRRPQDLTLRSAMQLLLPNPSIGELPVLPQLHDGRYGALVLVNDDAPKVHPDRQLILRIWPTAVTLPGHDMHVWVGTVAWVGVEHLPLVSFPGDTNNYDQALARLVPELSAFRIRVVQRPVSLEENGVHWRANTLLGTSVP